MAYGVGIAILFSAASAVFVLALVGNWRAEAASREQVKRGKYLVTLGAVHRLPYAGLLLRQAGHGALSGRLRGRLRYP